MTQGHRVAGELPPSTQKGCAFSFGMATRRGHGSTYIIR
ncbi:hypothetical protein BH24ACT13_BH24ACT13_08840 [soil metagenome]